MTVETRPRSAAGARTPPSRRGYNPPSFPAPCVLDVRFAVPPPTADHRPSGPTTRQPSPRTPGPAPRLTARPLAAAAIAADAYREDGVAGLARLPDATVVVADGDTLILARGPFSPTPLYYLDEDPGALGWSLRSLAPRADLTADPAGVQDYLCHGFVPAPRTVLAGVSCLPPGRCLVLRQGRRFGEHLLPPPSRAPCPDPETALWAALVDRCAATSPGVVLLSGGLDSAVAAAAARAAGHRPLALHARFPAIPAELDQETPCAREVARAAELPYREVEITALTALRSFSAVVEALDAPLGDPVTLPFLLLARSAAGEGATTLTGEGGDQLFGSWSVKPMLARHGYGLSSAERSRAYLDSFHKAGEQWSRLLAADLRDALPGEPGAAAIGEAFATAPPGADTLDALRWVDIRLKGVQHILPRIAAMAGSCGVTLAHPFFAPELLALSFALEPRAKLDGAVEKALLKELGRGRVPERVRVRRKAGMGVPTTAWMRGALRPLAWRWLRRRPLERSGLLDPHGVRALLRGELPAPDARPRRQGELLWMLCVLEAWFASLRSTPSPPSVFDLPADRLEDPRCAA